MQSANANLPKSDNGKEDIEQKQKKELYDEIKSAIDTICNFGVLGNMDNVCTFDTFKMRVKHQLARISAMNKIVSSNKNCSKIRNDSDEYFGTIFMGDIDNLGKVNSANNEEIVDQTILKVIKDIRKTMEKNEIGRYDIGKLGDEIYIYVPDKLEVDTQKVINELNSIQENVNSETKNDEMSCNNSVGISFGACTDMFKGFDAALEIAEKNMKENKLQKKVERVKQAIDSNCAKEYIKKCFLDEIDSKLRVEKSKLTKEQYEIYKKNKIEAIQRVVKEYEEHKETERPTEDEKDEIKEFIENDIEREKAKIREKYSALKIDERDLEVLCIAKKLQESPADQIQKLTAFYTNGYEKAFGTDVNEVIKRLKQTSLIFIDLGRIKFVNDNYGHENCDRIVYSLMEKVARALNQSGIKKIDDIICEKISEYHILFDKSTTKESLENFKKFIDAAEKMQVLSINLSEPQDLIADDTQLEQYSTCSKPLEIIKSAIDNAKKITIGNAKEKNAFKKIENKATIYAVAKKTLNSVLSTYEYAKSKGQDMDFSKDI